MLLRHLNAIWLALGAFGGELVLLLTLPAIGQLYGAPAVALLSIATVATNCGKLLGCLKIDAALANVDRDRLGAGHLAAIAAAAATTAACFLLFEALDAVALLPGSTGSIGAAICVAFAGGAIQQSTTMRLLSENRLQTFALMKSFTSLMLVVCVFTVTPPSLLLAYVLATGLTVLAVAALYLRPAASTYLWRRVWYELRQSRAFVLKGAPAAALDSGNMFLLSILTVAMAGASVAGEAATLQRIALGPSLAASLLLSQHVWRQRFAAADATAWRGDRRRVVRTTLVAAVLSALVLWGLLSTRWGHRLVPTNSADAISIVACLAPLLAQYAVSALTVYFFKRERLHTYAHLQFILLTCLGAVAALSHILPAGNPFRNVVLLLLAGVILASTAVLSRRAVSS